MGRKAGQLIRCTCEKCGAVEMRTGCTTGFRCGACDPRQRTPAQRAHKAVADAIRSGELRRPSEFPCADCGKGAIEYDHRDYSKPLEVDPVCRGCNLRRGPALNA